MDMIEDFDSGAGEAPPVAAGSVRIGSGSGFAGDRIDPGVDLARLGHLDYLVYELLGERTVANAQVARQRDPESGFDSSLLHRLRLVAPHCAVNGTRIVTNGGAANPMAAAQAAASLMTELGLGLRIAAVTGDDVVDLVRELDPPVWESGLPTSAHSDELYSANAYLGASAIRKALDLGADIVITGRVADPSLYVGILAHRFGWDLDDVDLIGQGTVVGHLLECAGQITGGYFADPVTKPVEGLDCLGFPFADVAVDGSAEIGKLPGTGGTISVRTCTEQLLYEVSDPGAYITPDVVADFTGVTFEQCGPDRVAVMGGAGRTKPAELKVTLGYSGGWEGEGQITYAGPRAKQRAEAAAEIVLSRLQRLFGFDTSALSFELIGALGSFRGRASIEDPAEVRLRVAGTASTAARAAAIGQEVEALYTNGPAGGGGARVSSRQVVAVKSCTIPRDAVRADATLIGEEGGR